MRRRFLLVQTLLAASLVVLPAAAQGPSKQACVADNESAQDLRRSEKLLAARAKLVACVSASCPGPVREDCAQRLAEVDAATPTLVLAAKDARGNDLVAVRASIDGHPFAESLGGAATPLDPGSHRIALEGEGFAPAEKTIVLREGEKGRREVFVLERALASTPAPATATSTSASPRPDAQPGSTQRTVGVALGAAGIAGLVAGGIFGVLSKSTYDHALSSECGGDPHGCSPQGTQDGQGAHGQATASTIAFAAGGALLAAGAVIYFTAPRIAVTPSVGGLSVGGSW